MNSKRVMDNKERDEKKKEDENINNNIEKENNENNNNNKISKEENININNQENIEEEKNNEDPILSYMNSNTFIEDEEILHSSKIILEEINGDLFNGQKKEINAAGIVGGRKKRWIFNFWPKNF